MKSGMKTIWSYVSWARRVGWFNFLRYWSRPRGSEVKLTVHDQEIIVRARTPDLDVAMATLGGEFRLISRIFDRDYDGNIVDAGGYIGTSAIALAQYYPKAKITVVEPSSRNLDILKKNVRKFENINVVHGALTVGDEPELLLKDRGTGEWGFTLVTKPQDRHEAQNVEKVKCYRIDALGVEAKDIGILKLDIEGGEKDLFDRDREALAEIPAIIAELHDRILDGCSAAFFGFSANRWVIDNGGEKYISLRRN